MTGGERAGHAHRRLIQPGKRSVVAIAPVKMSKWTLRKGSLSRRQFLGGKRTVGSRPDVAVHGAKAGAKYPKMGLFRFRAEVRQASFKGA